MQAVVAEQAGLAEMIVAGVVLVLLLAVVVLQLLHHSLLRHTWIHLGRLRLVLLALVEVGLRLRIK
jgi:hypothetical protein